MEQGEVVFFKGTWGFIKPDKKGPDVFVHYKQIEMDGRKQLSAGQRVEFGIAPRATDGKPEAVNVRVLEVA